ncbi:head GIN domain-containing protein [Tamlana sp. I1]|uniref:head GIN domain-containing protein n=1 Tax=Tamlana sp. I1 TaxID=2762061 RepID=UPI00188E29EE|nr:head GIN domain-containing protein [Tamlana sp. I1]
MKRIFFMLTVICSGALFAQETIEKKIGDFTEVKVYDLIQVELVKSTENKIIITGENVKHVLTNNKNGKLKIKMDLEKAFNGNSTKVTLHYEHLDVIDVNEGAQVTSKEVIKQFEIDLSVQEGGTITIPVDVTHGNFKAVTGGIITTTGTAKNQKVDLYTGGIYKGEELKTENTDVSIKAGGDAYVHASDEVNVKIRAGGNAYIYGHPETINENKALGGTVKRMD